MKRAERQKTDFAVYLMWQDRQGVARRLNARCLDLSATGLRVETQDRVDAGTPVVVNSNAFGRIGNAVVRYCRRDGMKYGIGVDFGSAFQMAEPVRRKILEQIALHPPAESNPGGKYS